MVIEPSWWPISNVAIHNYLSESIANDENLAEKLSSLIQQIGAPAIMPRDGSIKSAARRSTNAIRRLAHHAKNVPRGR